MAINVEQKKTVAIESIKLHIPLGDNFRCDVMNTGGKTVMDYKGHIPPFMPDSDTKTLEIEIDLATGQILRWVAPTAYEIEQMIGE